MGLFRDAERRLRGTGLEDNDEKPSGATLDRFHQILRAISSRTYYFRSLRDTELTPAG
jgi:hypothetical protein